MINLTPFSYTPTQNDTRSIPYVPHSEDNAQPQGNELKAKNTIQQSCINELAKFECVVCFDVHEKPLQTRCCFTVLCSSCYINMPTVNKFKTCPQCSKSLGADALVSIPQSKCSISDVIKRFKDFAPTVITKKEEDHTTVLIKAITENRLTEIIYNLIDSVDIHENKSGVSALTAACKFEKLPVVKKLLEAGAKSYHNDLCVNLPLSIAALKNNPELAKLLLDNKANPSLGTKMGQGYWGKDSSDKIDNRPPILIAAQSGYNDIVELMINYGADINTQIDLNKKTPLMLACDAGHYTIAGHLLDQETIDLNLKSESGRSAMDYIKRRKKEMVSSQRSDKELELRIIDELELSIIGDIIKKRELELSKIDDIIRKMESVAV